MARLFVYGTLRHPPLLSRLIGRTADKTRAVLPGYRAAPLRNRTHPALVQESNTHAVGAVIELSDPELAVLDRFEGPDYERIPVAVTLAGGDTVAAETFLFRGAPDLVLGGHWDFGWFVSEEVGRWMDRSEPGSQHPGDNPL